MLKSSFPVDISILVYCMKMLESCIILSECIGSLQELLAWLSCLVRSDPLDAGWHGVGNIRIVRDKVTGNTRGHAFVVSYLMYVEKNNTITSKRRVIWNKSSQIALQILPDQKNVCRVIDLSSSLVAIYFLALLFNFIMLRSLITNTLVDTLHRVQEFESIDAAEDVLNSAAHNPARLPTGEALHLEYSNQLPAAQGTSSAALDWKCDMCRATNFARWVLCGAWFGMRLYNIPIVQRRMLSV